MSSRTWGCCTDLFGTVTARARAIPIAITMLRAVLRGCSVRVDSLLYVVRCRDAEQDGDGIPILLCSCW
jgi:hypothetical protein